MATSQRRNSASQVERIGKLEALDGMAEAFERVGERVELGLVLAGQPDPNEDAVVGIGIRLAQRLADDRDDPLPRLAGRLCDELLGPVAEGGQVLAGEQRELVAAGERGLSEEGSEAQPRIRRRVRRSACVRHLARTVQQPGEVDAVERRWHEPEDAERRVATTDVGQGR